MIDRRGVLFLINSTSKNDYSRYSMLCRARSAWDIEKILLDKASYVTIDADSFLRQGRKRINLREYTTIVYWPASYQYMISKFNSVRYFKNFDEFIFRSWNVVEEALFTDVEDKMINSYEASRRAANKAILLIIAKKRGWKMPNSVITNNASAISKNFQSNVIIKTVTDTNDINRNYKIFPTRMAANIDKQLLVSQPVLAQEEIASSKEIRVYVFENKAISVIIPRTNSEQIDVRLKEGDYLECKIGKEPQAERIALNVANELTLKMCAIDFIEDINGELYLIDVNPHGSWHWLEPSVIEDLDGHFIEMIENQLNR